MDKWTEMLFGLIILIGAILVAFYSRSWTILGHSIDFLGPAWIFLKGGFWWLVFMVGLLLLFLGINDLRE